MFARSLAAALLVAATLFAQPVRAQEDQTFSPKQAEAVRKIVRDYLMEHPEAITQAIEALREKMRQDAESDAKKSIEAYKDELLNGAEDPVSGNPKGDVTIVEFFDYNCGFCKQTYDALMDSVRADGHVKAVFKEYPILSPESGIAAHVALAARKQGKYDDVHRAFMKFRGRLDEKAIWRLAGEAGLNVEQAKKDAADPAIEKQIERNRQLARALDIGGTPSFVIGDRVIASALERDVLKQLFDITRKGGKLSQ